MNVPTSEERSHRLIQAVQYLSLARDIEQIQAVVRTAARELAGADGATFVLRDGDCCHYVDEDAIGPLWKGQRFPMSACVSGWSMLNRDTAIIPDVFVDARIPIEAYRRTFVKSLVMVPIRQVDPIGAIGAYWGKTYRASDEEVAALEALANTTAVALENVHVYQHLEQLVSTRTAQLEAANHELDAFAHSVSHDLRAPLRRINGFAELLQEHLGPGLDDEGRHFVDRITSSVNQMTGLIEGLLAFSRLGRRPLHTQAVDLASVVEEARREAAVDAAGRAIEWTTTASGLVMADPVLLRQALINLLSNAVKFTRSRQPARIEVGMDEAKADGYAVVFVRDNGVGFDPKYAHQLFGVFQRLHSDKAFEGTGIGLANVRRIINRHGGWIEARGEVDRGATFSFALPRPTLPRPTS